MNIPAFLTEKLTAQVGEETARRIFAGFEAKRKTTLRVNRLKAEPMQILKALADAGLSAQRVPWSGDALILDHADEGAVAALPMFESGEIYMQSLSSMIPPLVLGAQPEENILDMAAAGRQDDADRRADGRARDDYRVRAQQDARRAARIQREKAGSKPRHRDEHGRAPARRSVCL